MNQQKKELLTSIKILQARIKETQYQQELDKRYLVSFYDRNQYALLSSLIPALIIGWKGGKLMRGKHGLKAFTKYGFLTLINLARRANKLI